MPLTYTNIYLIPLFLSLRLFYVSVLLSSTIIIYVLFIYSHIWLLDWLLLSVSLLVFMYIIIYWYYIFLLALCTWVNSIISIKFNKLKSIISSINIWRSTELVFIILTPINLVSVLFLFWLIFYMVLMSTKYIDLLITLLFSVFSLEVYELVNIIEPFCESEVELQLSSIIGVSVPKIKYIPWINTNQLANGVASLNRMYNHLDVKDPLRHYINTHCQFLLSELTGYTNIPVTSVAISNLITNANTVKFKDRFSKSYASKYVNLAGVYLFFNPEDTTCMQCGSALDFNSRLSNHFQDAGFLNKPIYNSLRNRGGMSHVWFYPVFTSVNWELDYRNITRDLTPENKTIIRSFTQQYIRSVEQAVTTYIQPQFGNTVNVNLWHTNWVPGYALSERGFFTSWVDINGNSYGQKSMAAAGEVLGISLDTIARACNCTTPHWVNTPNYGKVIITVKGKPSRDVVVYETYKAINVLSNTSNLISGMIYLFDHEHNLLPYGPFTNTPEVNTFLGFSRHFKNRRWVNKLHLIKSTTLGISVYLVRNAGKMILGTFSLTTPGLIYTSLQKPVILTHIETGVITEFSSVSKVIIDDVRLKKATVVNHIQSSKPFEVNGEFYLLQYLNPKH